jgi:transcriptional regulator with XRE-family HTH domain
MESFITWLEAELIERDWRLADLARKANLDTGSISRILSGTRKPGPEVCVAIARALNYPPEVIFRLAGLLPPDPGVDPEEKEVVHLFRQLGAEQRKLVLEAMRVWAKAR